jgi:hypothetical protein
MKTFREFILEAQSKEDAEKKRLTKDNPDEWRVRNNGNASWTTKRKKAIHGQGRRRSQSLKDLDSDLDPKQKERGDNKTDIIKGKGKEHHHLTSISQSAKEFKGLSPEERKAKREKDAKSGKFHGSDPRNIAQTDGPTGGSGIPHRGQGGYHSRQKPVGKGGSIQDFGSEKEIVAADRRVARQGSASERLAREKGIETPKMQRQRELRARMAANAKARGFGESMNS